MLSCKIGNKQYYPVAHIPVALAFIDINKAINIAEASQ